jgi:hypothetical protein
MSPISTSSFSLSFFLSSVSLSPSSLSLPSPSSPSQHCLATYLSPSPLTPGTKYLLAWKDDRAWESEFSGSVFCEEGDEQEGEGKMEVVGAAEFRSGDKAFPTLEGTLSAFLFLSHFLLDELIFSFPQKRTALLSVSLSSFVTAFSGPRRTHLLPSST